MKKKWLIISAILVILLMGCAMVGPILSNVEHPNYEVILAQPPFEIRQYSPMVIAEVEVKGERKKPSVTVSDYSLTISLAIIQYNKK
jgi:hypothetical protein